MRTVFFMLIICSLAVFTVFSTSTGDTWLQTTQVDFDAGEITKVDIISDPGNVTLSKVWTKIPTDNVLDFGPPGSWDDEAMGLPSVLYDGSIYHMWYSGNDHTSWGNWEIGYANSTDGIIWTKYLGNPVLTMGPAAWDSASVGHPSVYFDGITYHMWYYGSDGSAERFGYANSTDRVNWNKYAGNPVLSQGGGGTWDDGIMSGPHVIYNGTGYEMWYNGYDGSHYRIGYARSPDCLSWTKPTLGLILYGGNTNNNIVLNVGTSGSWDDQSAGSPSVYHDGITYHMWYHGNDGSNIRIGYANSSDAVNWTKYAQNPVLDLGAPGSYDDTHVSSPWVHFYGTGFQMWYTGKDGTYDRIGYAESDDGITWTKMPSIPVLDVGAPGSWDDYSVRFPSVLHDGSIYHMWYSAQDGSNTRIGHATSSDGYQWTKDGANPVLDIGPGGSWDDFGVYYPDVIYNGSGFQMWYTADSGGVMKIGYATSPDGSTWTKHPGNPVLDIGAPGSFDEDHVYSPTIYYDGLIYHMWYSGTSGGFQRTGYATSPDGVTWTKYLGNPVLDVGPPGSWEDVIVRAPSVHYGGSIYHMWYTGSDGISNKIGHAISTDGINWSKDPGNPVVDLGFPGTWDDYRVNCPSIMFDGSTYRMWYSGHDGSTPRIGYTEFLYYTRGNLTSSVFDSGADGTVWNSINWTENLPSNTNLTVATRTGDMAVPDGSWSTWSPEVWNETGLAITSPRSRYMQYRATLYTSDRYVTPTLSEVRIDYSMNTAQAPILSLPSNNTVTPVATPTFGWVFNDLEADSQIEFEVQIDDDPLFTSVDYSSGDVVSILEEWTSGVPISDGIWFWRVRTMDEYGLWSNWSENWTIIVDTTPPEPFIPTANPGSWTNNTQPEITFTTTDTLTGIDHYEVRIDTGFFTTQTSPYLLPSQNDGIHNITVRAFDVVGNYRDGYVEVFIDTIPPAAPTDIITIPDTWTNSNSFSINWTYPFEVNTSGIKNGALYKIGSPPINNSDGTWQGNKPITVTSIEGAQTIYIWLEDNVGNRNYTHYNTTILYLDITPPDAFSPTADPDDWTADNQPQITFFTTDALSGISHYEIKVDSGGFTTQTSPYILPAQTDGTHTITVRAYDNVGYYREGTVDIYIDTTPPEAPTGVVATPDTWTRINSFEIDWTNPTESDTSGIKTGAWYKIGSPPTSNSDGTWLTTKPITVSSLEGEQTVYIWLEDNVGNVDYLNYGTTTLYLDTTPPQAPIGLASTPSTWTNINSFSIQWTNPSDDSGVKTGAWYKIGSAPTSNSDGTWMANKPFTVTSIESEQPIYVWLEDNLGNVDYNNYATINLYLDTTPPAPPGNVISSPGSWTIANSFSIDWINPADDSGIKTGAWYKIDSPPSSESEGTRLADKPISITSMEGEHTVYIWLEDNVGNKNHLNYSIVNLYLDSIAPNISHSAVTKADPGREITITATVTDNVVVKIVRLHYRKLGDEAFEIINMSNVGDVYTANIPSSSVTTKGIEYYISASDEINTATHPSSNAITDPQTIEIEDDPEPCFISLWWLFLLLAIILIIIFLLLALRRDEEEGGNGAIPQEEPVSGQIEDSTTIGEEPAISETGEHQTPVQGSVPPAPPPSMADDEIFEQIKQLYEKGELSEETFEDIKKRYGK